MKNVALLSSHHHTQKENYMKGFALKMDGSQSPMQKEITKSGRITTNGHMMMILEIYRSGQVIQ